MQKDVISIKEFRALSGKKEKPKSKYRNQRTEIDGLWFDSLKEGREYLRLKRLRKTGKVKWFIHWFVFPLPGGVKMKVDWIICWNDGQVSFCDTKAFDRKAGKYRMTRDYINKKKQVRELYGVEITEI